MSNIYLYWWNFFILYILLFFMWEGKNKIRSNTSVEQSTRVHTNVQGWEDFALICSQKPWCFFPYPIYRHDSGYVSHFCTMLKKCVSHLNCSFHTFLNISLKLFFVFLVFFWKEIESKFRNKHEWNNLLDLEMEQYFSFFQACIWKEFAPKLPWLTVSIPS